MTETVTIPKSEYERLRALEEDFADIQAALAIEAKIASGEEELIPAAVVDRLLAGEAPLRVWREFRQFTQVGLAEASGVNRVQIVEIEAGRSTGSVQTLCKLATTLAIDVDDLIQKNEVILKEGKMIYSEEMVLWTKNNLKLPKESSPINFAVQKRSGLTSNAWGVQVENTGDAYIYCRDNMKGQKASLHASGKQHISFDENAPGMAKLTGRRFMNQWWEPQSESEAIATFKLVFPSWGIGLDAGQRIASRSKWNRNHVLIEGHDKFLTVISFVIIDDDKTLRKKEGSPPSYPIGILPLRPGKTLYVVAGWEPERNLKTRVNAALKKIPAAQAVPEEFRGNVLSLCLTGYSSTNSAFMVVVPVQWKSHGAPIEIAQHIDDRACTEFYRGFSFQEEGHYDQAIYHYTQSLKLNPNHTTAYINRGNCYRCRDEFDHAIEDYNKAIELEPDAPAAYNNRAHTHMKKGEFGRAIQDYNKAIELEPNLAAVYFNRGVVWLQRQEWSKANSDLRDAGEKGFDVAAEFCDEHASVSDFERQHGVNVPENIKAMLTPRESVSD